MGNRWYSRPVFFVRSAEQALRFYGGKLAFHEAWRYAEGEAAIVAQVERDGLEIILDQRAIGTGQSRIFLSLDRGASRALADELRGRGVTVTPAYWGMPVLSLSDPDGNEILFTDDELRESQ